MIAPAIKCSITVTVEDGALVIRPCLEIVPLRCRWQDEAENETENDET